MKCETVLFPYPRTSGKDRARSDVTNSSWQGKPQHVTKVLPRGVFRKCLPSDRCLDGFTAVVKGRRGVDMVEKGDAKKVSAMENTVQGLVTRMSVGSVPLRQHYHGNLSPSGGGKERNPRPQQICNVFNQNDDMNCKFGSGCGSTVHGLSTCPNK